jgi:hypothetical protein
MKEFFKEFNECEINVLYTFSNTEFEYGYNKLKLIHSDSNIHYVEESKFQNDLIFLTKKSNKYSVFFVDDNVFKEPFSLEDKEFKIFSERKDILTLSLRLHPRLNYCYPARLRQVSPQMDKDGVFNWYGRPGDFGYPMSLDGHIFETLNILYYLYNLKYNGPNDLESQMAMKPLPIPNMICYSKSKIINIPVNKVQNYNNNVHGNIPAKYLNDKFLTGKIISLDNIRGIDNTSCHQEIELVIN